MHAKTEFSMPPEEIGWAQKEPAMEGRWKRRQPQMPPAHQNSMRTPLCRFIDLTLLTLLFAGISACSSRDNPDEIRQRTADATATMKRDAKAIAEGVKEGMGRDKTININKASREDLLSLPGLTEHQADRIIAGRPFDKAHDLVTRQVVSESEYAKIRDRVIADH
jgi:competence protein ComEA